MKKFSFVLLFVGLLPFHAMANSLCRLAVTNNDPRIAVNVIVEVDHKNVGFYSDSVGGIHYFIAEPDGTITPTIERKIIRAYLEKFSPRVHPDDRAKTQVIQKIYSPEGVLYLLNIRFPQFSAREIHELLGFRNDARGLAIPHPDTINRRLRRLVGAVDISFIPHQDESLPMLDFMRLILNKKVPISMNGQTMHDAIDHAAGYYLLSQSRAWPVLNAKLRQLFAIYDRDPSRADIRAKLGRINGLLEAATAALPNEHDAGNTAFEKLVDTMISNIGAN